VRSALAATAAALVLGGCASLTPAPGAARINTVLRRVQTTHELPTPAAPQHAPGAASPAQAIRRFAERYVNWSAANVAARMGALARASVGQARAEMALTATQVRADRSLAQAGIANHGAVEAVARIRRGRYLVVTREWTTATYTTAYRGLQPAWHVTLVTVARVRGARHRGRGRVAGHHLNWVVSVWQPQS